MRFYQGLPATAALYLSGQAGLRILDQILPFWSDHSKINMRIGLTCAEDCLLPIT
jgi:hypothetical protein